MMIHTYKKTHCDDVMEHDPKPSCSESHHIMLSTSECSQ